MGVEPGGPTADQALSRNSRRNHCPAIGIDRLRKYPWTGCLRPGTTGGCTGGSHCPHRPVLPGLASGGARGRRPKRMNPEAFRGREHRRVGCLEQESVPFSLDSTIHCDGAGRGAAVKRFWIVHEPFVLLAAHIPGLVRFQWHAPPDRTSTAGVWAKSVRVAITPLGIPLSKERQSGEVRVLRHTGEQRSAVPTRRQRGDRQEYAAGWECSGWRCQSGNTSAKLPTQNIDLPYKSKSFFCNMRIVLRIVEKLSYVV